MQKYDKDDDPFFDEMDKFGALVISLVVTFGIVMLLTII